MSHALTHRPAPTAGRPSLILLALLFGATTYAILSLRAGLAPEIDNGFAQLRRLVGTAGGAFAFWLILLRLDAVSLTRKQGPIQLAAMLAVAGVGLLAVRVGFGWVFQDYEVSFARNLRWTIVLVGYLGLGVGLYLAYQLRVAGRVAVAAPAAAAAVETTGPSDIAEAVDWLADTIIAEYAAGDVQGRRDLADRIAARAGYKVADPLGARDNCRVEIMERIARRLAQ